LSLENWTPVKDLSTLVHFLITLSEAEFQSNELINLVIEILRQHTIQLWHGCFWLILAMFTSEDWE
jgi:hypothetical protein